MENSRRRSRLCFPETVGAALASLRPCHSRTARRRKTDCGTKRLCTRKLKNTLRKRFRKVRFNRVNRALPCLCLSVKKFREVRFNRALPCLSDSVNQLKLKGRSKSLDLKHLSVRSPCYWLHHDWLRNLLVVLAKAVFKQTVSLVALLLRGRRRRRSRCHALALGASSDAPKLVKLLKLNFSAVLLFSSRVLYNNFFSVLLQLSTFSVCRSCKNVLVVNETPFETFFTRRVLSQELAPSLQFFGTHCSAPNGCANLLVSFEKTRSYYSQRARRD